MTVNSGLLSCASLNENSEDSHQNVAEMALLKPSINLQGLLLKKEKKKKENQTLHEKQTESSNFFRVQIRSDMIRKTLLF